MRRQHGEDSSPLKSDGRTNGGSPTVDVYWRESPMKRAASLGLLERTLQRLDSAVQL